MELSVTTKEEEAIVALLEQMACFSGPTTLKSATGNANIPSAAEADSGGKSRGWKPDLRYRSLVERLPVVTFMASLDERMQELYVSPQIETLLGFTQEEWLDNPILWYRQLHPDDRDRWVEEFARTCAQGENFRAEYRLIARDGHIVWVQGECQLIRDEEGRPLFLQGIAFDITHLKHAAAVEEAKLAAEAASSAKSEFLARMSHEIRTPLNGVVGMIDLLRATGLTDAQTRYALLANEAADALMMVINDILDFSKIEAGKVEIEAIEFDLHKVVEDLTELLSPVAKKKGLVLAPFLRHDVPRRCVGDPNRIRQILTNLVGNALKFTTRGSVSIRVSVDNPGSLARNEGPTIRFQVDDTGIGIPADRLDRLFKSFSQVDTSTTRKFGGTGLGLAISKRLVELMGGEIGINSVEGKGTTFWFTIKPGVARANETPAASDNGPADALCDVRVLAVEPEATYRRILTEQLDGRLSPTSKVVDVAEALDALRLGVAEGKPFAVALVPYGSQDVLPLTTAILADPTLQKTKLIAITDIDNAADNAALKQSGYFARLHRPLTQSRLLDTIASATVKRSSNHEAVNSAKVSAAAADAVRSLKGLHLLVAEDNEMNQFVTQETLRRAGCTCDIVGDGQLAVEANQRRAYDAILMDCQMPGMDGLEATRRIRDIEANAGQGSRRIPIIALTAEAIQGDREKCLGAGMDGYVTKPIHADALFAAIREVTRATPPETPAPATAPAATPVASTAPLATASPETKTNPADAPIDIESLVARCMHDAQFAIRTLEKFQHRALSDLDLLRKGVGSGDVKGTTRLAHNLKAVAAHVAAGPLRKIAFEIEQAGGRDDLRFIEEALAKLDEEARRCASYVPEAIARIAKMPARTK